MIYIRLFGVRFPLEMFCKLHILHCPCPPNSSGYLVECKYYWFVCISSCFVSCIATLLRSNEFDTRDVYCAIHSTGKH